MKHSVLPLALLALACGRAPETRTYDVVVYGATPGGVAAAVNAAREGVSTALLQEDHHIGGLASGGLSNSDFRSFESLGGTFLEFTQRVKQHYAAAHGPDSQQVVDSVEGGYYEPSVARKVFEEMLREAGVAVHVRHRLLAVSAEPSGERRRITQARFTDLASGRPVEVSGRMFIDGTYEGDLLAQAGIAYHLGCESKAAYGESLAFDEENRYVQTYNFRVCMSRSPANRIPLEKPSNYDRKEYAPLIGYLRDGVVDALDQRTGAKPVLKVRPMANDKADFNDVWQSPISLSVENVNHPWPEGSPEVRQRIFNYYKDYSVGLLWFLTHDPEVPADWRAEMAQWGLPKDEYPETGHWTPALYVREGRRMIGMRVFIEQDTQPEPGELRARLNPDAIAMADYSINCHGVWSAGPGQPSLGHLSKAIQPYQVPYGVLLSKDVDNFLAPVPMSASHVGFAALRMEPAWTAIGQAAGVAAAMSLKTGASLRALDVPTLQLRLHELGAKTVYVSDLGEAVERAAAVLGSAGQLRRHAQPRPAGGRAPVSRRAVVRHQGLFPRPAG
ncbi:MAG: FAD-dependent oxidoreductase [Bryobacterales bacterium]|nr:FAD-dependent oxidoreductase [Bryobacterales bacterium]